MKIDRLISIIGVLTNKERVTIQELADKFEVTKRTIFRDLDTLNMAGIPIVSFPGVGGGISVAEGYKVNRSILSEADMKNLYVGLHGLRSIESEGSIQYLINKLLPKDESLILAESDIIIDLSSWFEESEMQKKVKQLHTAIANRQCVEMDYITKRAQSKRVVEPHKLVFKQSYWYLYGFCLEKHDFRLFKLSRILSFEVLDSTFIYRPNHEINFDIINMMSAASESSSVSPIEVILECNNKDMYAVVDKIGSTYLQPSDDRERNTSLIRFYTSNMDGVADLVLSLQGKVRALEPASLRQIVKNKLENMYDFYKDDI
ncbi:YafY family transcriptional regulator [Paenibacillus sp. MER TA 81-3]|uniref:helix-turn-helix transcriptional regulator n=1 Tax=Paenibacillus sp. MER TA 81-3 TaxID=2939573 RepID=UPI0020414A02|nr:YafY family protein [Paenibacillus sp. MER TA 81-3]MCM3340642.1 YafY family transcriptional regulator [Paenibacillus sp. MER TA 81-3]